MLTFIGRRIIASFFIILGASFLAFILVSNAGNPLEQAQGIQDPVQRNQKIKAVTATLHLDVPVIPRFFIWLKGVLGCFVGQCDFGQTKDQVDVTSMLGTALLTSLRLIVAATVLAVFIGITIGVISALRQYSGLDYAVTFLAFLFFALPVFWFGVLLKDAMAIQFNAFLRDGAAYSWRTIMITSIVVGVIGFSLFGGAMSRRLLTGLVVGAATFGLMYYVTVTHWLNHPSLGIVVIAVISVALSLGITVLTSGLRNKRSLYTGLTTVGVGVALWYPLQFYFYANFSFWKLVLLLAIAIAVGVIVGFLYGGNDKGQAMRTGGLVAFTTSFVIFADRLMRAWPVYVDNPAVHGVPIRTTLPGTPNLVGDFWIQTTDVLTHLVLPTITLMLISLATHSRFARASLLEVLNQDYIRTARSKGLTERTVIMRHAFRNALIPLATVVAFDIAGLIGGAVLTETVFSWKSMGRLFQDGLSNSDPNPVMAFFVVAGLIAVLANLLADLAYAGLDPRIRVK